MAGGGKWRLPGRRGAWCVEMGFLGVWPVGGPPSGLRCLVGGQPPTFPSEECGLPQRKKRARRCWGQKGSQEQRGAGAQRESQGLFGPGSAGSLPVSRWA